MVKTPSNVSTVHEDFSGIVNFEIVPKELLYDWVVVPVLGVSDSEDLIVMEVQDDVSDKVNELESIEDEEKIDDELLVPPGEDENSID